jgi:hypothetical protein
MITTVMLCAFRHVGSSIKDSVHISRDPQEPHTQSARLHATEQTVEATTILTIFRSGPGSLLPIILGTKKAALDRPTFSRAAITEVGNASVSSRKVRSVDSIIL